MAVVETSSETGVRTVTLNRPAARNALSVELLRELSLALGSADSEDSVAAVVLTGADPAFCAGLDLNEFADPSVGLLEAVHKPGTDPFAALRSMTTPVVAAVNGPAITGGLEIALNCDFIVASDRARFGDSHAKVGALPGGGMTGLLPQAVGLRLAKELSFTGRIMDAEEALRTGLANHVVAHEQLLSTAGKLAAAMAAGDQRTIREVKRLYNAGARVTLDECDRMEAKAYAAWEVSAEEIGARREAILAGGRHSSHRQ